MKKLSFVVISLLTFAIPYCQAAEETLEKVQSRGVTQQFALITPDTKPVASVILLAGGHGKLDLDASFGSVTYGWGGSNNLVRTREMYAKQGLMVAVMDAASDRGKMNAVWRMGEEHAQDIKAVVDYLKHKANIPVWVIGTSMGTFSAANAGIRLGKSINGIVLTSSITKSAKKWAIYDDYPKGVINMNLNEIKVPVLVVSHKEDNCDKSPAKNIDVLASQFKASPKVEKALFTGGDGDVSAPCQANSYHGYLGIEGAVVNKIVAFIKSN